jgi:hypothetical protein
MGNAACPETRSVAGDAGRAALSSQIDHARQITRKHIAMDSAG